MFVYESRQDFADKADYEGGLLEFITGYGVHLDQLPPDDYEFKRLVEDVLDAWTLMEPKVQRLIDALPEPEGA